MKSNQVAKRYANSLFLEAVDASVIEKVYKDVNSLGLWFEEVAQLDDTLSSGLIALDYKHRIWEQLAKKYKLHKLTHKFVHLVIEHGRANLLVDITLAFKTQYKAYYGIEHVEIVCAGKELSKAEQQAVVNRLIGRGKKVEIKVTIDSSLIGGFIVKKSNSILDASIRGKLDNIKNTISIGV